LSRARARSTPRSTAGPRSLRRLNLKRFDDEAPGCRIVVRDRARVGTVRWQPHGGRSRTCSPRVISTTRLASPASPASHITASAQISSPRPGSSRSCRRRRLGQDVALRIHRKQGRPGRVDATRAGLAARVARGLTNPQ
jgi:hypothetical protein